MLYLQLSWSKHAKSQLSTSLFRRMNRIYLKKLRKFLASLNLSTFQDSTFPKKRASNLSAAEPRRRSAWKSSLLSRRVMYPAITQKPTLNAWVCLSRTLKRPMIVTMPTLSCMLNWQAKGVQRNVLPGTNLLRERMFLIRNRLKSRKMNACVKKLKWFVRSAAPAISKPPSGNAPILSRFLRARSLSQNLNHSTSLPTNRWRRKLKNKSD